jgi:putative ABC transport system permease protein
MNSPQRPLFARLTGPLRVGWRILVSNQPRTIILAAGSVSIALAAASLAAAAVTSRTIVGQTVDAGWRGAYDLLVQPADATTYSIGGKQLVPSDFLAVRSSGITRAEWQAIQQIPGVEVAAPLATLGWMRPDDVSVGAEFATPDRGELVWISEEITIADGSPIRANGYVGVNWDYQGESFYERYVIVGNVGSGTEGMNPGDAASEDLRVSLPSQWGDIVGIDPVEEDRLVGLNGFVTGPNLHRGMTTTFDQVFGRTATQVPVLTPTRMALPGQVTMSVSVVHGVDIAALGAAVEETRKSRDWRNVSVAEYFAAMDAVVAEFTDGRPVTTEASDTKTMADLIQPLRDLGVGLVDGQLQAVEYGGGTRSSAGRNVLLEPAELPYDFGVDGQPKLENLGTWGDLVRPAINAAQPENWYPESSVLDPSPQYRPLTVTVPEPFLVDALGTYDLDAIGSRFAGATNYVPLGIYGDPARKLVADAAGNPVNGPLPISLNPGGLNPLPPIGLTNLETVEALRGDRFIDAIRVRVADIDAYTPAAVDRIARVAQAIRDRTGLHVDVVAGSSPVDVDVDVADVGTVRERWTTLGEAPRIVSGADGLSGLLLGGAGLVVVLYLGSFGVFLVDDQRRSLDILRQVGWRGMSRTWLLVSQALLLGLAAATLSVLLLALFDATTEVDLPAIAYPAVALAVVAAHMLAAGLAGLTGRTQRERSVAEPARWLSLGIVRLGLRNSLETPRRLLTVALALALAILVSAVIATVEIAYGGELRASVLGGLVWLRVGWFHLLAAGAALFAAASIALDSGVLAVERRVGLIALLRATGWRGGAIGSVIRVEAGLPAFAGGLLALLPVVAVGAWVGLPWPALVVLGAAAVVLGGLVALVVAALPVRLALAVDPARGLAAEGMTGALPGFASRAALAVIVVLAMFVTGAGVGYGVLAPAAIPPNAFVPVPSPAPPSAESIALAGHVDAIAGHADRVAGNASFDWTLRYVTDFVRSHGGSASSEEFLSFMPQWFDASGNSIDVGAMFSGGLAVTPQFTADAPLPFTASELSQPDCAVGLLVLRVSDADDPTRPFDTLSRCSSEGTTAVLTVRPLADEAWTAVTHAASVGLTAGEIVWATVGSPADATPLLVVPVGSTGPVAAQSAAPIAVALELAAKAHAYDLPLRLAFADLSQPGTMSSLVRRATEKMPLAPVIELGPLGGRLAAVRGEHWTDALDEALLGSLVLDDGAGDWVARTADLAATDTSAALLSALTSGAPPDDVHLDGVIAPSALAIGIDAAYLGEPTSLNTDTGTPADTPDQLDNSALEHTLAQLVSALEVLDAATD